MSTPPRRNNNGFPHVASLPAIKVERVVEEIPMKHLQPSTSPYARREMRRWSPISISSDEDYEDELDDVVGKSLQG